MISPLEIFRDNSFMLWALLACWGLVLSGAPLGVLLSAKKMALSGDSLGHALLPGAALGYLLFGTSLAMALGALGAGLVLALASSSLSHRPRTSHDNHLAVFYLSSLALGVLILSIKGSSQDLMHLLFGQILETSPEHVLYILGVSLLTLLVFFIKRRALILQSLDPIQAQFKAHSLRGLEFLFLSLVVVNLVVAFQILGTLLAVGLLILPPMIAKPWAKSLKKMFFWSAFWGLLASWLGLTLAYGFNFPAGPSIILVLFLGYALSWISRILLFRNQSRSLLCLWMGLGLIFLKPQTSNAEMLVAENIWVQDIARCLLKKKDSVVSLIPEGVSLHDFDLRPKEAEALSRSKVILLSGGLPESKRLMKFPRGKKLFNFFEVLLREIPDLDPHFWLDPRAVPLSLEKLNSFLKGLPEFRSHLDSSVISQEQKSWQEFIDSLPRASEVKVVGFTHGGLDPLAKLLGLKVKAFSLSFLAQDLKPRHYSQLKKDLSEVEALFFVPEHEKIARSLSGNQENKIFGPIHIDVLPSRLEAPQKESCFPRIRALLKHNAQILTGALK